MISKCQQKNLKILEYVTLKLTISVIYALFLHGKLFVRHEAGHRSSIWKNGGVEVPSIWQNNWGIQTTFYHKTPPSGKKKPKKKKTAIKKNFFDETTPNSCHADCDTNKQGEETPSIQEL